MSLPVLVLTARGSWHEKVQGIDGGADDYVAKPFRMEEVLARLRALIRRASGQARPELRAATARARPAARASHASTAPGQADEPRVPRAVLPDAPARAASSRRAELTEHIYAQDADRDSNTVEVFIARLRRKLGAASIETVRGLGYRDRRRRVKPLRSLRSRVILGAVLWTIGLFTVSGVVMTKVMQQRFPGRLAPFTACSCTRTRQSCSRSPAWSCGPGAGAQGPAAARAPARAPARRPRRARRRASRATTRARCSRSWTT